MSHSSEDVPVKMRNGQLIIPFRSEKVPTTSTGSRGGRGASLLLAIERAEGGANQGLGGGAVADHYRMHSEFRNVGSSSWLFGRRGRNGCGVVINAVRESLISSSELQWASTSVVTEIVGVRTWSNQRSVLQETQMYVTMVRVLVLAVEYVQHKFKIHDLLSYSLHCFWKSAIQDACVDTEEGRKFCSNQKRRTLSRTEFKEIRKRWTFLQQIWMSSHPG